MPDSMAPLDVLVDKVRETTSSKKPDKTYVGLEHIEPETLRVRSFTAAEISTSVNFVFQSGDILFGKLRPNLKKVAQVETEGYCSTDILVLRPRPGVHQRYAAWVMQSPRILHEAEKSTEGTRMPRTSWPKLRTHFVYLPIFDQQWRIAEILDGLDRRIDKEKKALEKLGLARDVVLLRELRKIAGYRPVRLEDIAAVDRGRFVARPRNDPRFYGGAYPFIQTGDVARESSKVIYNATQSLNEDGRRMSREFPAGTIAVTIAANIGETSILGRPMCFPDSIVGIVVSPSVSTRFIELCIRRLKPILESRAPQSAQKNINLQDLRPLEIPLPSGDAQMSLERLWAEAERLISEVSQGVHKLRMVKQGLTEDLLTGRVRTTCSGKLTG